MKRLNRTGLATLALLVTAILGCAHTGAGTPSALAPRPLAEVRPASFTGTAGPSRPAVALVLGGGGLRGFAHVGVLRALEAANIRPDIVVGTSAGAVVGAAYASGMSPALIEEAARRLELSSLVDWTLHSGGIMHGKRLAQWVDTVTGGAPGAAIQASAAVPGITVPVAYRGGHLLDGGIASLVPVRFARAMGADFVIAVDIYCHGPRGEGLAVPAVLHRVMQVQSCLVAQPEMAEADVLVAPAVTVTRMSARNEQERAIQAGYEATREALAGLVANVFPG